MERDDVRTRLQRTALVLFREHGFDRVTAMQIAARAGVTERTFFRYFADKREVLFDGEAVLRAALTAAMAEVPEHAAPLAALFLAFHAVVPTLEGNRAFAEPRQAVIAAAPALQERELAKLATLADVLTETLRTRGVPELQAVLAARAAMAAFAHATIAWLDDPAVPLAERLHDAEGALRTMAKPRG